MKQSFSLIALLLFFLIFSSSLSAHVMAPKEGEEEMKLSEITTRESAVLMEASESMNQLMGLELCENGDDECFKRRITAEAHLDYIYTQHHKP